MALLRYSLLAIAAAFVTGCGGASNSDYSTKTQNLVAAPADAAQPVASKETTAPEQTPENTQNPAFRKAALSLASVTDPKSAAYKIGPRDVLEITVFKVPELSKVTQVSEAGTISYPLAGEIKAGGRTAREVEQDLTTVLGAKYLQNPQVNVFVKEYNSQRVTLEGAVKKPGVYPIAGGMSLLQAVATAGGFEANADESVLLFRQSDGRRSAARYDVSRIRGGEAEDPQLQSGDVIIAGTSDLKEGMNLMFKFLPLATMVPYL